MGKKGARRKTRWRTLSIGTPPGEEDEEEGVRSNGYAGESQARDSAGYQQQQHQRNGLPGPPWLKSRHGSAGSSGSGNGNGSTTSGYASGGSRSRRGPDDPADSPTQQRKLVFNEEEYTRITTPRQDMLFKKGYLSQRKLWHAASTASMSATPSTTESQSASHSTADGSEAAEDQQLLDSGEYAAPPEAPVQPVPPQLGYGTYYDHASGYYYEYPMMLVGPAMPEPLGPNILAAMPCAPVPLRPIEWVNPAFVPKLASQQYCYMDYQATPGADCAALVDAQGVPVQPVPAMNGLSTEASLAGSASVSANGSVADEPLGLTAEPPLEELEALPEPEQQEVLLTLEGEEVQEQLIQPEEELELQEEEGGLMEYPEPTEYVETLPAAAHQPLHLAHMMAQPMGQPYLYPGQYMFGPPVVNVNGVTMQSGPILRCSDMVASTAAAAAACAKRRKKKKKRKQKRPHALGNTEDEDEEDYSSEGENGLASSRVCWSVAATPAMASFSSNRPLNPECQEFHLRPATSTTAVTSAGNVFEPLDDAAYCPSLPTPTNGGGLDDDHVDVAGEEDAEEATEPLLNHHANHNEPLRLTDGEAEECPNDGEERLAMVEGIDEANPPTTMSNGVLTNGDSTVDPPTLLLEKNDSSNANGNLPRRKYSAKSLKFAREPTPGPDLDDSSDALVAAASEEPLIVVNVQETGTDLEEVTAMIAASCVTDKPTAQKDGDLDICRTWVNESSITSESCCNENNEITTMTTTTTTTTSLRTAQPTAADEDSGFESQTKLGSSSSRPITAAVTEWLKSANSPNLFIMSSASSDDDDDEEDEDDASVSNEPSKNLQGNPMPALSVNAGAEDGCQANRGEFAKPADRAGTRVCETVDEMKAKRSRKSRGATKRKATKNRKKNSQENEQALARASTQNSAGQSDTPVDQKIEAICEFTGKDSDAGMRVAENSRITISPTPTTTTTTTTTTKGRKTERPLDGAGKSSEDARLRRVREGSCKSTIDELQSVKTFEKGEIVVSMDGELLHVAAVAATAEDRASLSSWCASEGEESCGSTAPEEQEPSLGSIEEPDVLECWEAESLEPLVCPKKLETELSEEVQALEHVQRYYRLQASVTSVEDELCSEPVREEKSPLSTPMSESTCSEEIVEVRLAVPEVRGKSCEHLDPRLPVDEAFEVYESCYNGRPTLPFAPGIDKSTRLLGRRSDDEGPIPCRAVCCNIQ